MREAISEFMAIGNSGKFTAYSDGVPIALPTGETVQVKIQNTKTSMRPQGFSYSKYSFVTEVTAGTHRPLLAQNVLAEIQKVIGTENERTPAIQSEPVRQSSKTPVLVPHMFRRGRRKACDPVSVVEANSNSSMISSGYVGRKWCTHPGSNGEPSVPKTDALSS